MNRRSSEQVHELLRSVKSTESTQPDRRALAAPSARLSHTSDAAAQLCGAAGGRGRDASPLRVRLNAAHGKRLLGLGYDLVRATTWGPEANEYIGPLLGLPRLPVVEWGDEIVPELDGLLFKTRHVVAWAAGRPFAWVDDALTAKERRFVGAHHPGPALLHHVDPRRGLRAEDFAALARWAEEYPDG